MQMNSNFCAQLRQFLHSCSLPGSAPDEIHGACGHGCLAGDDFFYQGCRYVCDVSRDVLVREDIQYLTARRQT